MLSVEELWSLIDREISELPAVRMPLAKALGRRLGAEIVADADMPAFSRSAIDGYALADGSGPGSFRVIGEARPGGNPFPVPAAGEAIRIFTGSALPDSGVGLVMVEDTSGAAQADRVVTRVAAGRANVRSKGSQAKRGAVLLPPGATVTPGAVAVLASVGVTEPPVSPVARIAHLATGSELVDARSQPATGLIRDSNSPLVAALVAEAGAERVFHARVSESVEQAVAELEPVQADLLLVSGGASVGAYDGTIEILTRLGFVVRCSKVKSRPGKPLIFATKGKCAAFGLPGNPLSHFVCFHLFVRRAIDAMAGRPPQRTICVHLEGGSPPPQDPRETWWPARLRAQEGRLLAAPLAWRDSSDVTALALANALLRIRPEPDSGLAEALLFGKLEQ
jgi:molybdopterin molybdotransferase